VAGADKSLVTLTFSRRTGLADADEFAFSLELARCFFWVFRAHKKFKLTKGLSRNARELAANGNVASVAGPHNEQSPVTPDMVLLEISDELNLASLSCMEGWCRATETMSRQVRECVTTFGCVCASQVLARSVCSCTASRAALAESPRRRIPAIVGPAGRTRRFSIAAWSSRERISFAPHHRSPLPKTHSEDERRDHRPSDSLSILCFSSADEFFNLEKMLPGHEHIPTELSLAVQAQRMSRSQASLVRQLEEAHIREAGMLERCVQVPHGPGLALCV